ncbi:hypothetical protein CPL00221_CDS0065 [Escherichia phage RobRod40]
MNLQKVGIHGTRSHLHQSCRALFPNKRRQSPLIHKLTLTYRLTINIMTIIETTNEKRIYNER